MSTLQESILDAISVLTENSIKNTPGTKVIDCIVSKVLNPGLGEYEVTYLGNKLLVHSSNPNVDFNINDKVYVLVPEGDFSKEKIILGVSTLGTVNYDTSELNKYMQVSDNLLVDKGEIELCTYKNEIKSIFNNDNNEFNIVFPKYLEKYNTFMFSAKIKTNIPIEQQVNGNYGLILQLPFYSLDNKGEKIELWKNYILDINNISGNPYRLTEWSNQTMFIQIDSEELYDIDRQPRLTTFVENFAQKDFKKEEKIPYDIFIKDIKFVTYDILTEEHKVGYYLHLSASEGNYFFEGSSQEKTLISHLKVNGRDVKLTNTVSALEEVYKCYWFKEDASIKNTSDFYSSIGGIGWKCLNQRTNVYSNADGSLSFDLITNQYSYVINKDEVLTSARFKCVIVISKKSANGAVVSTTVSNIIKLENIDSILDIDIVSATGSNSYIKNIGEVNLICNIVDKDKENSLDDIYPNYIITYEWNRYDKNGNYLDNNFYSVVSNKDEIITDTHYISQQIKFATNLIETANIFTCSAYINYIKDEANQKVNQIKLLGTESILIDTNGTAAFNLSIQNGDILYKYDAEGDSPLRENYDGPLESKVDMIKPLTYTIYKADGTELTDSEYNYCQTTWLIPVNSLIIPNNLSQLPIDGEYYVYSGVEFNYTLANTYNFKKTNNTIILKVKFGEVDLTAAAAIKILKEGDNGTNNSNYSAVIEHNGASYGEYKDGVIQKFQVIYCAEGGTYQGIDYKAGWYYHNLNYKTNNLPEIRLFESGFINDHALAVKVYRAGEEITENYQIEWSMFDKDKTNPCFKITTSQDDKTKYKFGPDSDIIFNETDVFVNIIQAKITISNKDTNEFTELYAYYPIEIIRVDKFDCLKRVNIEDKAKTKTFFAVPTCNGGFSSVLYASDGTNPKYNSSEPFICTDAVYSNDSSAQYNNYIWDVGDKENTNLTIIKKEGNQAKIKPCSKYNSSQSKNYIKVSLNLNENKETELKTAIETEKTKYNDNNTLIVNTESERDTLETFFKGDKYISQSVMISALDKAKTFIDERTIILNALDEVEKRLNVIYNYSEDLAKLIDIEELRKEQIINAREQLRITKIDNLQIDEIDIDNIKEVIEDKNKRRTITNFSKDYNESVKKYINLKLTDDNNFINLLNNYQIILDGLVEIKSHSNLYQQLLSIKNKFTVNSEQCCITYASIKNDIIEQTYKLLSQYGNEHGLNGTTINYYSNLILEYENAAAAALQKAKELQTYLIEATTAIIYIRPIVMLYNRYELSDIVGWDGNKLYTGGEGQESSYLYAPRVGAGKKEEDDSFTGVVIGNRNYDNKDQTGLFGYHYGISTIFLDAETGSATFGKSGKGQIIIEPGNEDNEAVIYGGNYVDGKSGLIINLTKPFIKFGSGNFEVDENGHITAKGGGSIGGWIIGDTQLYSDMTDERITLDAGTTKDGVITYGIYSHSHNTLDSRKIGFYLSKDGLSIGKSIEISSAENGDIKIGRLSGNGTKYWTIGGTSNDDDNKNYSYISYNTDSFNSSNLNIPTDIIDDKGNIKTPKYSIGGASGQVYIGTDGLRLGNKFAVDNNGNLVAKQIIASGTIYADSGTIGGWEIGSSYLKGGNLQLNSNGSISATNWNITKDGRATFEDVEIKSGSGNTSSIGGITILTDGGLQSPIFSDNDNIGYQISSGGTATFHSIKATGGTLGNLSLNGNLSLTGEKGKIICNDGGSISYSNSGLSLKHDNNITLTAPRVWLQSNDVEVNNTIEFRNSGPGGGSVSLDYETVTELLGLKSSTGSITKNEINISNPQTNETITLDYDKINELLSFNSPDGKNMIIQGIL